MHSARRVLLFVAAFIIAAGFASCGAAAPDLEGVIERVTPVLPGDSTMTYGSVTVQEHHVGEGVGRRFIVTVAFDTAIQVERDGQVTGGGFSDLEVGRRVRAWFEGPEEASYPAHVTASRVVEVNSREAPP